MKKGITEQITRAYRKDRELILDRISDTIISNRSRIIDILHKTDRPTTMEKAQKIVLSNGREYFYIVSAYFGENFDLEWDSLIYTFDDCRREEDEGSVFKKDLIYFSSGISYGSVPESGVDKKSNNSLSGTVRYTGKFLELYNIMYGEPDWNIYEVTERWVRRNTSPIFIISTEDPLPDISPNGCNVLGKDHEGTGVCIGRLGEEDDETVKFVAYYPEYIFDDPDFADEEGRASGMIENFRSIVKPIRSDSTDEYPNKFMLNRYRIY